MRQLADFVERMMTEPVAKAGRLGTSGAGDPVAAGPSASSASRAIVGTRTRRTYGAIAATAFDEIIVREDKNLRGRAAGETAANVIEGVRRTKARRDASRTTRAEKVLDEMTAVRAALRRAIPGDLVVCCVDDAIGVYREAMAAAGTSRGGTAFADPGELEAPEG